MLVPSWLLISILNIQWYLECQCWSWIMEWYLETWSLKIMWLQKRVSFLDRFCIVSFLSFFGNYPLLDLGIDDFEPYSIHVHNVWLVLCGNPGRMSGSSIPKNMVHQQKKVGIHLSLLGSMNHRPFTGPKRWLHIKPNYNQPSSTITNFYETLSFS